MAGRTAMVILNRPSAYSVTPLQVLAHFTDPTTHAITAVAHLTPSFSVAGDHRDEFNAIKRLGLSFTVTGGTNKNGTYTVASVTFGASTVVTVNETIADTTDTADGTITVTGLHGFKDFDNTNGMTIPATADVAVTIRNPTSGPLTITVTSEPDRLNRSGVGSGDITSYSIDGGNDVDLQEFPAFAWALGGKVAIDGDAGLYYKAVRRAAGT